MGGGGGGSTRAERERKKERTLFSRILKKPKQKTPSLFPSPKNSAWDTLFWFAILVGMSGALNSAGVVSHFAGLVGGALTKAALPWPAAAALLSAAYWALHYLFASQTAHVGALYSAFLAMMLAAGVPGQLGALVLAWVSNLFGSLTHYGSGQAAVYYGSGYITLADVFKCGAVVAVANAAIWGGLGFLWWKCIGLA